MIVYVVYRTWAGAPIVTQNLDVVARYILAAFEHPEATSLEYIKAELAADLIDIDDDSVWDFDPEEGLEEHIQVYKVYMSE